MSGSHPIKSNKLPAPPVIAKPANVCQNAGNIVFTATGYSGSLTWTSYTGGTPSGASVTFASAATGTKSVTARSAQTYTNAPTCYSATVTQSATVNKCCDAPGATVDFTAFNPCSDAATYSVWYLTDTREANYNNTQTYKVKLLADGHYWMVQDMKFGNRCNKTTFSGSNGNDQTGKVSDIGAYYGDCRSNTQPGSGYLYDWAAAINKTNAYYGGSEVGCSGTVSVSSGTTTAACQGICPTGWHVPTGSASGEYTALHNSIGGCSVNNDDCWDSSSLWEGVYAHSCDGDNVLSETLAGYYWSSTRRGYGYSYILYFMPTSMWTGAGHSYEPQASGKHVRCIRNY
jgi:uncharacterized protein (TIGR02145 family)